MRLNEYSQAMAAPARVSVFITLLVFSGIAIEVLLGFGPAIAVAGAAVMAGSPLVVARVQGLPGWIRRLCLPIAALGVSFIVVRSGRADAWQVVCFLAFSGITAYQCFKVYNRTD